MTWRGLASAGAVARWGARRDHLRLVECGAVPSARLAAAAADAALLPALPAPRIAGAGQQSSCRSIDGGRAVSWRPHGLGMSLLCLRATDVCITPPLSGWVAFTVRREHGRVGRAGAACAGGRTRAAAHAALPRPHRRGAAGGRGGASGRRGRRGAARAAGGRRQRRPPRRAPLQQRRRRRSGRGAPRGRRAGGAAAGARPPSGAAGRSKPIVGRAGRARRGQARRWGQCAHHAASTRRSGI